MTNNGTEEKLGNKKEEEYGMKVPNMVRCKSQSFARARYF